MCPFIEGTSFETSSVNDNLDRFRPIFWADILKLAIGQYWPNNYHEKWAKIEEVIWPIFTDCSFDIFYSTKRTIVHAFFLISIVQINKYLIPDYRC